MWGATTGAGAAQARVGDGRLPGTGSDRRRAPARHSRSTVTTPPNARSIPQSDAEYDAIAEDVAAEFEGKTLPTLRAPARGTGMGDVAAAAEGRLAADHQHAEAIKDKLGVLEKNAYWPKAAKLNIAQRLIKALD